MRQHPGSFIHLSPLDQTTNDRRTHLLGIDILFLDLRHTEAELVMQSVEQPVISLLVVAEAVVETDDQILHPHLPDQIVLYETLGRNPAEGPVERNHDQIVDSEPVEQVYLLFERSQQPQPLLCTERHAGMRVEGQHDTFSPDSGRLPANPVEQNPVSAMNSVVRSDGSRRRTERRQIFEAVEYSHRHLNYCRYSLRIP